jgi:hypothetical protein
MLLLLGLLCLPVAQAQRELYAPEVSPAAAWDYLTAVPYQRLPRHRVTYGSFFSRMGENLLVRDSRRTIESADHFIPPQRKLLFPNGICLRGEWRIDQHPYRYTGYFAPGSRGVLIGRAAVSLSNVNYDELRTLAISGKIFPTQSAAERRPLPAANFLLMNDNAGLKNRYLMEAPMTNAAPRTISLAALPLLRIALAVADAFDKSDVRRDVRQLYPIAELEARPPYVSPKWMRLRGTPEMRRLAHELKVRDFRQEARAVLEKRGRLEFDVFVAHRLKKGQPEYHKIGQAVFTRSVASRACDESLHFQHVPYREEYALPVVNQQEN